jgi:hypothetical protein
LFRQGRGSSKVAREIFRVTTVASANHSSSRAAGKVKGAKAGSSGSEQQQNCWSSWTNKIKYNWLTPIQRCSSNKQLEKKEWYLPLNPGSI